MLTLLHDFAELIWTLFVEANRWLRLVVLIVLGSLAFLIVTSIQSPEFSKVVVPIITLFPIIVFVVGFPVIFVVAWFFHWSFRLLFGIVGLWLAFGAYLSLVPVAHNPRLIMPLVLVILAWLFLRLAGAGKWWTRILALVVIVLTVIFFLGTREKANARIEGMRNSIGNIGSNVSAPPAYQPATTYVTNDAGLQSTEPAPLPVPLSIDTFTPTGYKKRFCGETAGNEATDFSGKDIVDFKVELSSGCFAGPIIIPAYGWGTYIVDKSEQEGDWATMWCVGRSEPSRIYLTHVAFHGEFKGCSSFYLQGKGSILFKAWSR